MCEDGKVMMNVKELEDKIAKLIRDFEKKNPKYYVDDIKLKRYVLLTGEGGLTLNVCVKIGKLDELYANI